MKSRSKKIIYIVAAVIVASIFAVVISAKVLFSPQRVTLAAEEAASRLLSKEVSIENARMGFAKIILEGIVVEGDAPNRELLICERVEAKFKILPLFRKQVYFSELIIKSPLINLSRKPTLDIGRLLDSRMESIIRGEHTEFNINRLDLKDASINFYPPDFPALSLKDINVRLEGTSIDESLNLMVSLDPGLKYVDKFNLKATVNILRNEAFINHIVLEGEAGRLYADGEIKSFFTAPSANLQYKYSDFPGTIEDNGFFIEGAPKLNGKIRTREEKLDITVRMDMEGSSLGYKDIFRKLSGERLRLQGGFSYSLGDIDINWYLLETSGGALSGTGSIFKTGDASVNLIGEDIDLQKLRNNFSFIEKYIAKGNMDTRSVFERADGKVDMKVSVDIDGLGIINFGPLEDLYKRLTGKSRTRFNVNSTKSRVRLTSDRISVDDLQLKGGDVEGSGKGYYKWGQELDFTLYPRIEGRRIGLRVYGSTDNVRLGLK